MAAAEIGGPYLSGIRQYLRLVTTTHDKEIEGLIRAARADLVLGGVAEDRVKDETDPLILRAVATFVKAEFGLSNSDSEKYRAAYQEQRNALTLSDAYLEAQGGQEIKK